ncbi:hypothetical protein B9J78_03950 [bacterium Unc6]|nr:hypothetical protein [bacterium Unc6]
MKLRKEQNSGIELIEHTADIGLILNGKDLKSLFKNAALGLFQILADIKKIKPLLEIKILVEEDNLEFLLVRFLQEIVYISETQEMAFKDITIEDIKKTASRWSISSALKAEPFETSRRRLKTSVKAVTYHNLYIKKTGAGYQARVIFDV